MDNTVLRPETKGEKKLKLKPKSLKLKVSMEKLNIVIITYPNESVMGK